MSTKNRHTPQRASIESVLNMAEGPLTPQEVLAQARKRCPGLGIATVYRAIRDLLEENRIRSIVVPGKAPLYERTDLAHHHHFQCESCGQVTLLEGCSLDAGYRLPRGFKALSHVIIFNGICPACAR